MKVTANKERAWSVGKDFKDKHLKSKAKHRILSELKMVTGKEVAKSHSLLSSVISDLTNKEGFNEFAILSENTQERLSTFCASMLSACDIIGKIAWSTNLATAKVFTAVTAVLLPPTCLDKRKKEERYNFCKHFLINGHSKYFESAVKNRTEYNAFLGQEGDISIGKKVSC